MASTVRPHERLQAWEACRQLTLAVYRISAGWPSSERFGLRAQVRSAAVSATANIAEGAARRGAREFRRFLDLAVGSLNELACLLTLAQDLGYVQAEEETEVQVLHDHASRLTWGLLRAMSRRS